MWFLKKIVSGGQTGADRAGLDWAIHHGVPHGGWCPQGRIAEDGILDLKYHLLEVPNGSYRQRTKRNVMDSDGTLILNLGDLDGGTLATENFARQLKRPSLVMQLDQEISDSDIDAVWQWINEHEISELNVAGPRESKRPGIYRKTITLLDFLLDKMRKTHVYTVMPDFGHAWGWANEQAEYGDSAGVNCNEFLGDDLLVSEELSHLLYEWQKAFEQSALSDPNSIDWEDFHWRGLALAKRLKVELGDQVTVIYEKPFEDPTMHANERYEILRTGGVVPILRNRE